MPTALQLRPSPRNLSRNPSASQVNSHPISNIAQQPMNDLVTALCILGSHVTGLPGALGALSGILRDPCRLVSRML